MPQVTRRTGPRATRERPRALRELCLRAASDARDADDMPQPEVVAIRGIPLGTVYSRIGAARESLRRELAR